MSFYTSLNADTSETRKDIKKRPMVFLPIFPVLSYQTIKFSFHVHFETELGTCWGKCLQSLPLYGDKAFFDFRFHLSGLFSNSFEIVEIFFDISSFCLLAL